MVCKYGKICLLFDKENFTCIEELDFDRGYCGEYRKIREIRTRRSRELWQKRCKCGRKICQQNNTGLCRDCYIKNYKREHKINGNNIEKGSNIYKHMGT